MKNLFLTAILLLMAMPMLPQKNRAITANYQHLHNAGNHGIGIGFKTNVWNKMTLLTDAFYYFNQYHGNFYENYQKEYNAQYYTVNVNLGYNFTLSNKFCILPYIGVGVFHEFIDGYMSSKGSGSGYYPPGTSPGTGAPYNVSIDDNILSLVANLGFSVEYYLTHTIFFTAGAKYMLDTYDGTYNEFPNLTAGIGYKF